jgi:hypothetical protein
MGALKKLRLAKADVEVPGGESLAVRGVSLRDLTALVRLHGPALATLFDQIKKGDDIRLDLSLVLKFGRSALEAAPELVADLIVLACGDEIDRENHETAAALPFPVQLEAIKHIALLTFGGEDSLGKFVETVVGMAQGASQAMTELQKPLGNGSAVSAIQ